MMMAATLKMQRIKRKDEEPVRVHFCLPASLKAQLMEIARLQGKSLALLMREIAEAFVEAVKEGAKGAEPYTLPQLLTSVLEGQRKEEEEKKPTQR